MWPTPLRGHEWLVIGASLLASAPLGWGSVPSAAAAEVEVTREMRYSEDFGERAKDALDEMVQDLAKRGCKTGGAYAYSKEEDPRVVVLAVRCLERYDQVAR